MRSYQAYVGDNGEATRFAFTRGGTVRDISGAVDLTLVLRAPGGKRAKSFNAASGVTVYSGPAGLAEKTWTATDLDQKGPWLGQLYATLGSALRVGSDPFTLNVGESLGTITPGGGIVLPNATAAQLQAAAIHYAGLATSSRPAWLRPTGILPLEAVIDLTGLSNLVIDLSEAALRPTFSGTVDDELNCIFRWESAVNLSLLNTVLATDVPQGSFSCTIVGSVGALAAGQYVVLDGKNVDDDEIAQSAPGITLTEIKRVLSATGSTINFETPTKQFHTANVVNPCTVRGISTLARNVRFIGGEWDGSQGQVACGILARRVEGLRLDDLRMQSFTRSGAILDNGTHGFRVSHLLGRGKLNGLVHLYSAMDGTISDISTEAQPGGTSNDDYGRYHEQGRPRPMFDLRGRSTRILIDRVRLNHCTMGVGLRGVQGVILNMLEFEDVDPSRAVVQDGAAAVPELQQNDFGVCIDGSLFNPPTLTEYSHGIQIKGIRIGTIQQSHDSQSLIQAQDWHAFKIHDLNIDNRGLDPGVRRMRGGIHFVDSKNGIIGDFVIKGIDYAIRIAETANAGLFFHDGIIDATAGTGGTNDGVRTGQYAFSFEHINNASLRFRGIRIANYDTVGLTYLFGNGFADQSIEMTELHPADVASRSFARVYFALNQTGAALAALDVVALDPTPVTPGRRELIDAVANDPRAMVVISAPAASGNQQWCLVADPRGGGSVRGDAVAVQHGDLICASGTSRRATVNNSAAAYQALGRAVQSKAASVGEIELGPV